MPKTSDKGNINDLNSHYKGTKLNPNYIRNSRSINNGFSVRLLNLNNKKRKIVLLYDAKKDVRLKDCIAVDRFQYSHAPLKVMGKDHAECVTKSIDNNKALSDIKPEKTHGNFLADTDLYLDVVKVEENLFETTNSRVSSANTLINGSHINEYGNASFRYVNDDPQNLSLLETYLKGETKLTMKSVFFSCSQCSASFNLKENLSLHILTDHIKGKNQSCLNKEAEPHYQCLGCKIYFASEKALNLHFSTFHAKTYPHRPSTSHYLSSENNETLPNYNKYIKHQNIPSLNKCKICGCTLNTNLDLILHMKLIHSQKALFKCFDCNEGFENKESLVTHFLQASCISSKPTCSANSN